MKFAPQEITQLIELRSRMFLAIQECLKNPTNFDTVFTTLWKLESISREYTLLLAPYYTKAANAVDLDHGGFHFMQVIMGAHAMKNLQGVVKELNKVMFDPATRDAMKHMFTGSPVIALSAPVSYGSQMNLGGEHKKTVNGRLFAGEVKSYENVSYQIEFSDHTKLQWKPTTVQAEMDKIRNQFNQKIAELAEVKKLHM